MLLSELTDERQIIISYLFFFYIILITNLLEIYFYFRNPFTYDVLTIDHF